MAIQYELKAAEILRFLGYREPAGQEWAERFEQESQLRLPAVYREFITAAFDCPMLGTSNLWVGAMAHHAACLPHTLYDNLREEIADRIGRWSKPMPRYEKELFALSELPEGQWPEKSKTIC